MTPEEISEAMGLLRNLPPTDILYRALFAECRGEPIEAQVGVGCVIRQRVRDPRWPDSYAGVILQPAQFSAFLPADPNFPKLLNPEGHEQLPVLQQLQWVAQGIVNDLLQDNVAGANHYYDFSIIVGRGRDKDAHRLIRYLDAVDVLLDPFSASAATVSMGTATARDLIHTLVAPLPPKWDDEVWPVARKGRIVFFKL